MSTNLESLMAALTKELHTLNTSFVKLDLSLIHISEPTRHTNASRMPSSA